MHRTDQNEARSGKIENEDVLGNICPNQTERYWEWVGAFY